MSKALLKSTGTVGAMTLLSRILGFLRDMVIARAFGAGTGADAFFVAFRIPNFLRRLFAEGSFSQAFVPVLSEYKSRRSEAEVRELNNYVVGVLGGVLFLVTLAGVLAAPLLIAAFAPGFISQPDKFALTAEMLRITFPYLIFISLTAFAGSILNTYGRFGVPAVTPVFLNLLLIWAALWLAPRMAEPVVALAWGVFLAGAVQLIFQIPFLLRLRMLPRPRWQLKHEGVQRIFRLMLPTIFGSSVAQINLLIDTVIASFLVTGSVSWLYYSDRLVEFPLGVFGVALATVILPSLSQKHAEASPEQFSRTMDWALRWVAVIGPAATVGLIVLGTPMLVTLFRYGEFSAHDVTMSSYSLMAFAVGLTAFILIKVLASGFYSRQDTRTPVRIAVAALILNLVFNLIFVYPLGHAGLALATSLAAIFNAAMLFRALYRSGIYRPRAGWKMLLLRVCIACAVMAVVLWLGSGDMQLWLQWHAWTRVWHLLLWTGVGALVYLVCLFATGLRLRDLHSEHG